MGFHIVRSRYERSQAGVLKCLPRCDGILHTMSGSISQMLILCILEGYRVLFFVNSTHK